VLLLGTWGGTLCELDGNTLGTKEKQKIPPCPSPPHPTHQRKNLGPRGCMLHHLIGLFQLLFLNSREQDIEASIEKRLFA